MALRRLKREYKQIINDPPANCSGGPIDGNYYNWVASIMGPTETPFEGGVFMLKIDFPPDYPFKQPKFKFTTPIYHPNIDTKGNICLDILKDKWSPALTVSKVLLSICSLLIDPNPKDPLRIDAAELYIKNKVEYDIKVRKETQKHAI